MHFTLGYALNLAQAAVIRRYGFLAAITLRWPTYLVWHIIYGNLISARGLYRRRTAAAPDTRAPRRCHP